MTEIYVVKTIRTSHSLESLDYKFIEDNLQTEWVFSMNEEGAAD